MLSQGVALGTGSLKIALNTFSLWKNPTPPSHVGLQLPVEILQKIFLLLAEPYASEGGNSPARPHWIAITHVCRYWRSAALGLHELWSSITPGLSISWSLAMMERSAPLPVRIDIHVSSSHTNGLHPLAASELLFAASRIRTLRLVGLRADILRVLDRLRSPSPLESLDLCVIDSGQAVDLPETLFGGKAPHFRRLTFACDAHIRAPRWLLAGITHFTTGADVALPGLLDALREMPQLEMLRIPHCRAVWEEEDAEMPPTPRVVLPRLSLLSFRDTTPRRFIILSAHIDAPPTLRRHFFWRAWAVPSWDRWANMLAGMRTPTPTGADIIPRDSAPGSDDGDLRVVRVIGGPARGSFEVWSRTGSEGANTSTAARDDALFLFHIDWRHSPVDPHGGGSLLDHSSPFFHLAGLCAHLRATRVEDLTVASESASPDAGGREKNAPEGVASEAPDVAAHWQALLAALPSVRTLRLHRGGPACVSVLRVLASSANSLLPDLQKIFVVQNTVRYAAARSDGAVLWNFKRLAGNGTAMISTHEPAHANVGAELVAVVKGRYGLEVVLVGCEVDDEALDALRKRAQVDIGDEWVYV
ncbi:hypothetical protein EDB85DRAFT_1992713 [Lactarius pseudohatsudake]|nr:hypothetical protein EDB85DRAFT_1992713 [Lactarius pseudohatsudake]